MALGPILEGARPREIRGRVELALGTAAQAERGAPSAGPAPRERARGLLRERRFTGAQLPRPFTGVLRWLDDRLAPVSRFLERVAERIPGGRPVVYVLVATLVMVLASYLSMRLIRRKAGRAGAGGSASESGGEEDFIALERGAEAAERDGRWEDAVRLRFRAGLVRLGAEGVVAYRPSLTTGEVARQLESTDFDALGRDFDAIAYGGRPAEERDAIEARERWSHVRAGTGRS